MSNFVLFKIRTDMQEIVEQIVEAEIEGDEELVNSLVLELKLLNYSRELRYENDVKIIKNSEAAADAHYKQSKEFEKRSKALKNVAARLKSDMLDDLREYGEVSTEAGDFVVKRRKNPQPSVKVMIPNESLPKKYQVIKVDANKTALKQDIKDGKEIEGVMLVHGEHIRIEVS